jgi:hypothetical protein
MRREVYESRKDEYVKVYSRAVDEFAKLKEGDVSVGL